jgi:hypothetical protein
MPVEIRDKIILATDNPYTTHACKSICSERIIEMCEYTHIHSSIVDNNISNFRYLYNNRDKLEYQFDGTIILHLCIKYNRMDILVAFLDYQMDIDTNIFVYPNAIRSLFRRNNQDGITDELIPLREILNVLGYITIDNFIILINYYIKYTSIDFMTIYKLCYNSVRMEQYAIFKYLNNKFGEFPVLKDGRIQYQLLIAKDQRFKKFIYYNYMDRDTYNCAIIDNNFGIVKLLYSNGIVIHDRNIQAAVNEKRYIILEYLLNNFNDISTISMFLAITSGDLDIIGLFEEHLGVGNRVQFERLCDIPRYFGDH